MSSDRRWVLALLVLSACADLERGPAPPLPEAGAEAGAATDGGATSFATVRPLLEQGCQRCHAPGQMAGNTSLLFTGDAAAEYAAVHALIDLTSPARSRLLVKATGQGHGGGAIFRAGSPEYAAVLAWIQSGAAQ
jgi:mono/diheme cytochrome c family protein